jgi:hypothetical protein
MYEASTSAPGTTAVPIPDTGSVAIISPVNKKARRNEPYQLFGAKKTTSREVAGNGMRYIIVIIVTIAFCMSRVALV